VADQKNEELSNLTESLANILSGTLTVSVNNFPFLKIDAGSKTLDIEIKGFKESGLHSSDFIGGSRPGMLEILKKSEMIAKGLSEKGWRLRIFDGEISVISMGRGVSSLTGFIWGNPLRLSKILSST
jgi:hypothetical protein